METVVFNYHIGCEIFHLETNGRTQNGPKQKPQVLYHTHDTGIIDNRGRRGSLVFSNEQRCVSLSIAYPTDNCSLSTLCLMYSLILTSRLVCLDTANCLRLIYRIEIDFFRVCTPCSECEGKLTFFSVIQSRVCSGFNFFLILPRACLRVP